MVLDMEIKAEGNQGHLVLKVITDYSAEVTNKTFATKWKLQLLHAIKEEIICRYIGLQTFTYDGVCHDST